MVRVIGSKISAECGDNAIGGFEPMLNRIRLLPGVCSFILSKHVCGNITSAALRALVNFGRDCPADDLAYKIDKIAERNVDRLPAT